MNPAAMDERYKIHVGDCLDVLRGMPDCSVDACVTDPPYGLSFMGKKTERLLRAEDSLLQPEVGASEGLWEGEGAIWRARKG